MRSGCGADAERMRRYAEGHREELREYKAQWKRDNPESIRESRRSYKINRAARVRNNGGRHTKKQVLDLYNQQGGTCCWCKTSIEDKYHIDHIIPVSKGGSSNIDNLCLACPKCNQLKGDLLPSEWELKLKIILSSQS